MKGNKKTKTRRLTVKEVEENEASASGDDTSSNANDDTVTEANCEEVMAEEDINLKMIFKEIKDFRKDNAQQLKEVKEEIQTINARLEEVEDRVSGSEQRIQTMEDVMGELLKLQAKLESQLIDQEGRSRRNNVRIYGVIEGEENNSPSMIDFVEKLLKENLQLPPTLNLHVERAHRALAAVPPDGAPPRSIIARFLNYKIKDEVLRKAWQSKGFLWKGKQISFDNDYAPEVLKQRQSYMEAKKMLKQRGIRFQTPFPAKLRVFYQDGVKLYNSAEDATKDMRERGFPVTVYKPPETLLSRIKKLTWDTVERKRGTPLHPETTRQAAPSSVKERLQQYRWEQA
ncbi:unnamed protein product [Knipowitschia caucasica]